MTTPTDIAAALAIRVTFRDASTWLLPLEPYLSRWATEEGGAVAREVTQAPDMEFLHYCIESERDDLLALDNETYDYKRREMCDWLARVVRWETLRRRAVRVQGPRGLYGNHNAQFPRADMEIVERGGTEG